MVNTLLPTRLIVEPHIVNYVDDSDPHYDVRAGWKIGYRSPEGWVEVFYGRSDEMTAWLAQRGYEQVSCVSRRHTLWGRYETT